MTSMTISETPDAETAEWLTEALRGSAALPGDVRGANLSFSDPVRPRIRHGQLF